MYKNIPGQFVAGIQAELKTFEKVHFNFVRREANTVAHRLAKLATAHVSDVTDEIWLDFVPPVIGDIVRGEENILSL
jgi:hypothetical protein